MDWISVENVRCYGEEQKVPIRPITLLIGENSTGKSTLLAMLRAAWELAYRYEEPSFTDEPFDFGGYQAIAYYHGGRGKFAHEFSIGAGFAQRYPDRVVEREVRAIFMERVGQPFVARLEVTEGPLHIAIVRKVAGESSESEVVEMTFRDNQTVVATSSLQLPPSFPITASLPSLFSIAMQKVGANKVPPSENPLNRFAGLIFHRHPNPQGFGRPIATAPIRSRPERTYNPRRQEQEPEGSHVPFQLATLQSTSKAGFDQLSGEIARFGTESGLFSKLNIRRLGKKPGDPFQLQVAVDKFPFNVRDVGYGVSQVLPILVETLSEQRNQIHLLQQPEVHLHPRAQAALGSLLVEHAGRRNQTFVVETHSDHLVDRVRMDIRDKKHKGVGSAWRSRRASAKHAIT